VPLRFIGIHRRSLLAADTRYMKDWHSPENISLHFLQAPTLRSYTSYTKMARSNSAQDALNAINILIGLNVLAHMFRDDLSSQLKLNKESYRIFDGNIQSMFVSMFYHMEPAHLAINMLALYQYANELFVNSSSKKWRSLSMVIFAYLGESTCYLLDLLIYIDLQQHI
jgi:hypothetical protein